MTGLQDQIRDIGVRARAASRKLSVLPSGIKNAALLAMAEALLDSQNEILAANAEDVGEAAGRGLSAASVDRLRLDAARLGAMADGVRDVAALPDPTHSVIAEWTRPNGLRISKVRKPIGVIGIIYESRPNVTSDAAVLCVKTGNAVILRGGSESLRSNRAIARALETGGVSAGLPPDAVQLVPVADRAAVAMMAGMDDCIDVIVPRGGRGLIEAVMAHARMPVIKHLDGVCHVYVHERADLAVAASVVTDAKADRPSACNAAETLLVDRVIATEFFAASCPRLAAARVELRADDEAFQILSAAGYPSLTRIADDAWSTEYLDLILSVKIVGSLDEAVGHISSYGSGHSDAIVTTDEAAAERFLNEVDSAAVYWNASTRFTDGGEFGFGAEIGISTDKLHARGPMGLEELTTYRYLVRGDGQVRG